MFAILYSELWTINGKILPTLNDLIKIIDMTEEQLENSEDNKNILWYYDVFLPAAVANPHQYGPTVRHYKEYIDNVTSTSSKGLQFPLMWKLSGS